MKAVFLMLVVGVAVIPAAFGLKCYDCVGSSDASGRNGALGRSEKFTVAEIVACKDFKKDEKYAGTCPDGVCYAAADYKGSGCISKSFPGLPAVGSCGEMDVDGMGKKSKVCVCDKDLCNSDQKGGTPGTGGNKATSILGPSTGFFIFLAVFYLARQLVFGDGSLAVF